MPGRLTIVGTGLIGSSFALAARDEFSRIAGLEPNPSHARQVLSEGIVDEIVEEVAPDEDAILLACPSDRVVEWLLRLQDHPGTIFDVASVKGALISELRASIGRVPENYIPCHPIAGLERSGPGAADPRLFEDRQLIITPVSSTDPDRKAQVSGWWGAVGSRVTEMDPFEHDQIYALTSHLPHLLAFAYLQNVKPEHLAHTGGGFRDFSRIGGSDADMWAAIFDNNREPLLAALTRFERELGRFRLAIAEQDTAKLRELIAIARARRDEYEDD